MHRFRLALLASVTALALVAVAPTSGATTALVATVGPGFTITVTKGGKRVTTLRTGRYRITVRDRSDFHNFRLKGPGVNRATTVAEVATKTWTLTLRRGKFTFVCDPHASSMKGSFTVR
jgi:plastocyanin